MGLQLCRSNEPQAQDLMGSRNACLLCSAMLFFCASGDAQTLPPSLEQSSSPGARSLALGAPLLHWPTTPRPLSPTRPGSIRSRARKSR